MIETLLLSFRGYRDWTGGRLDNVEVALNGEF
jgi:hypothetical protein